MFPRCVACCVVIYCWFGIRGRVHDVVVEVMLYDLELLPCYFFWLRRSKRCTYWLNTSAAHVLTRSLYSALYVTSIVVDFVVPQKPWPWWSHRRRAQQCVAWSDCFPNNCCQEFYRRPWRMNFYTLMISTSITHVRQKEKRKEKPWAACEVGALS